jgi:hypothetical protein
LATSIGWRTGSFRHADQEADIFGQGTHMGDGTKRVEEGSIGVPVAGAAVAVRVVDRGFVVEKQAIAQIDRVETQFVGFYRQGYLVIGRVKSQCQ